MAPKLVLTWAALRSLDSKSRHGGGCRIVSWTGPIVMPLFLFLHARFSAGEVTEKEIHKMATSSESPALRAIPSRSTVPCHAPPNRRAHGYPSYPQAPTMTDETKPAQLANRNPGVRRPGCMVAGSGCRCSTPFLVSELPSERNPRRCSSPTPWDAWLALTPGFLRWGFPPW